MVKFCGTTFVETAVSEHALMCVKIVAECKGDVLLEAVAAQVA